MFKTMYTLDGQMLETLADLKTYCEEPLGVGLNLTRGGSDGFIVKGDEINDRVLEEPPSADKLMKSKQNNASFFFNPLKSNLVAMAGKMELLSPANAEGKMSPLLKHGKESPMS